MSSPLVFVTYSLVRFHTFPVLFDDQTEEGSVFSLFLSWSTYEISGDLPSKTLLQLLHMTLGLKSVPDVSNSNLSPN